MKVGVTANPTKPVALDIARRAIGRLSGRAEVVLALETKQALGVEAPTQPLESLVADVLVAIGGDGTFLRALAKSRVPLLPVNSGTFAFLAEIDGARPTELDAALTRVAEGKYYLEDRMKLAGEVGRERLPDATNEVVVHTDHVAKMRLYEVSVDGEPIGRLRADGIILATPTGSTSYALSAGGPIVDPTVEAIVVTPIAPFQTTHRAIVVDPLRVVTVRLGHPEKSGVVVVDGHDERPLPAGGTVVINRSPRRATFVRFGSQFFRRLGGKRILPWTDDGSGPEESPRADLSTST